MNRTSIEWCKNPDGSQGWSWNPLTGCLNHTNGMCNGGNFPCYAYRLANTRLKARYLANTQLAHDHAFGASLDPFYPRFWPDRLEDIKRPHYPFSTWTANAPMTKEWAERQPPNYHARRKKVGVFTCDMSDLFGIGIPEEWTRQILDAIQVNGVDRFYLLTKQPQNLIKFSPFPDNCWVGVTATNPKMLWYGLQSLLKIEAKIKYISFEPLLEAMPNDGGWPLLGSMEACGINWIIIGAQTKPTVMPKIEWVREIVEAADKAGIPVFLKNNLRELLCRGSTPWAWKANTGLLRQEMPE